MSGIVRILALPAIVLLAPNVSSAKDCEESSPWLKAMKIAFVGLQGADWHSTKLSIDRGTGREANPVVRWATSSDWQWVGVKVGVAGGGFVAANELGCRHPGKTMVALAAVNVLMGIVVVNNYRVGMR